MKNLLGRLMRRPLDELRVIAATWGTLIRDAVPSQKTTLQSLPIIRLLIRPPCEGFGRIFEVEDRAFLAWLINQRNMLAIVDDVAWTRRSDS